MRYFLGKKNHKNVHFVFRENLANFFYDIFEFFLKFSLFSPKKFRISAKFVFTKFLNSVFREIKKACKTYFRENFGAKYCIQNDNFCVKMNPFNEKIITKTCLGFSSKTLF